MTKTTVVLYSDKDFCLLGGHYMNRIVIPLLLASAMLLSSCSCSSSGSHYSESSLDSVSSSEESSSSEAPSSSSVISSSESSESSSSEEPVPQYFTVSFYTNGGVFSDGTYYRSFEVLEGTMPDNQTDVTYRYHDFAGWIDSITGKAFSEFTDGIHGHTNFQANWTQDSPVIFECNLENTEFYPDAKKISTTITNKNVDTLDITNKFVISDDAQMKLNWNPDLDLSKVEIPTCNNSLTIQVYNDTTTTEYSFNVFRDYYVAVSYYKGDQIVHTEEIKVTDSFMPTYQYGEVGYDFWYWADENGKIVDKDIPLIHDLKLYVRGDYRIFTVYLNAAGGECERDYINPQYGEIFNFPVATIEGGNFLGWWLDDEQLTDEYGHALQPWHHLEDTFFTAIAHYKMDIVFNYIVDQEIVKTEYYNLEEYNALSGDLWEYTEHDYFRGWYGAQWWFGSWNEVHTYEQAKEYFDEENNCVNVYGALYVDDYAVLEYIDTMYSWCVANYPDDYNPTNVFVPNTFNTERVAVIGSRYNDYDHVFPASTEELWIPNLMYEFNKSAFKGLPNLYIIGLSEPVPGEHNMFMSNGVLYNDWSGDYWIALTSSKVSDIVNYTAIEGTRYISWYVFEYCLTLQTADLNGVQEIREGAFKDCENLTSVSIYPGMQEIDSGAFEGCTSLTTLYFHGTVEEFGNIRINDSTLLNVQVVYC